MRPRSMALLGWIGNTVRKGVVRSQADEHTHTVEPDGVAEALPRVPRRRESE